MNEEHPVFELPLNGHRSEPGRSSPVVALGGSGAFLRFYGELNDFLPPARRGRPVVQRFIVGPSVKDAIESAGVPHPEVELIVANTEPVTSRTTSGAATS